MLVFSGQKPSATLIHFQRHIVSTKEFVRGERSLKRSSTKHEPLATGSVFRWFDRIATQFEAWSDIVRFNLHCLSH